MRALLEGHEEPILRIKRRQFLLDEFETELARVTRGKEFLILNDLAWLAVVDVWDMVVIDLASWIEGVLNNRGMFTQISTSHLADLNSTRQWSDAREHGDRQHAPDKELKRIHDDNHAAAYKRLFPNSTGPNPSASDVEELRNRFYKDTQHIDRDRNQNRAHRYAGKIKAPAAKLAVPEIAEASKICEQLMNDLRLLTLHSEMSYSDVSATNPKVVARNLVDMVLCGTSIQMRMAMGEMGRDSFYDQLHAAHDAAGPPDDVFNESRFLFPEEDEAIDSSP